MINDPFDRMKLMDLLRPPEGFTLDEAIGTTYSLDLPALLVAPVAFTLFDAEDKDGEIRLHSLEVLESLRRYARKLTVFCHSGRILSPAVRFSQFVHLENVVVQCLPVNGSFHPKVWVLRYSNDHGEVIYRFLCLTRNLAFDQTWDTALVLEGPLANRNFARNRPLADFVDALPHFAQMPLPEHVQPRVDRIVAELRRVDFQLPPGVDDVAFWPIGIDNRKFSFGTDGRRMLIMSPFLAKGWLNDLVRKREDCVLISTQSALVDLGGRPSSFTKVYTLNAAASTEPRTEDDSEETVETIASGLHAKCFVIDDGWIGRTFTGSANATWHAFNGNVEFLTELTGSKTILGIDALLKQESGTTRLADVLVEVNEGDVMPPVDEESAAIEKLLEDARTAIVKSSLGLFCARSDDGEPKFTVTVEAGMRFPLPEGIVARCWPVTLSEERAVPIRLSESPVAQFNEMTAIALTRFLNVEVVAGTGEQRQAVKFAVMLPIEGAPADREDQVLRSILTDRGRLVQYLMLLVADDAVHAGDSSANTDVVPLTSASRSEFAAPALLETFLRALDRAPERLDHVQRLVVDLRSTEEGRQLLPADFDTVWNSIWEARERRRACLVS
jgi:hypothetical protein